MRRGESLFELDPSAHEQVRTGFELEGSNLSGVSANRCSWWTESAESDGRTNLASFLSGENKESNNYRDGGDEDNDKTDFYTGWSKNNRFDDMVGGELGGARILSGGVHLVFNLEAGSLLPLAIR